MNKEAGPSLLIKEEVRGLLSAAKMERWDKVDDEIIPKIADNPDGDGIANELLKYAADSNSNIRDVVATGLGAIKITDPKILNRAMEEMMIMATTDEEKYPAGRAALFLYRHINNPEYRMKVDEALSDFKNLVKSEGWKEDLVENIPQLKLLFG